MCVCIRKGKVLLFSLFFLFLASMHLLLFVLITVHVVNELESNTVEFTTSGVFFYVCVCMSWCCLRAVRERGREEGGSREGNRIGCQGERRLCLMRSHPGNLVTPPTQPPPIPSFHLAPFECAHPLNPPPPSFAP